MVCLGNICRSPLAEGILATKCMHLPVGVDSAGTSAYHIGELPDVRSIHVAKENKVRIENQRARQLVKSDLENFDIIYAMDSDNYTNIIKLAKNEAQKLKVKLILNEVTPGLNHAVPDPYYGGNHGFKKVYEMLDLACENIKNNLEKELLSEG